MLLLAADAVTHVATHVVVMAVAMAVAMAAAVAILVVADAIQVADAAWVAFEKSCPIFVVCSLDADAVEEVDQAAVAIWAAVVNQVVIQVVIRDAVAIPVATVAVTPVAGQDARINLAS